MVVRLPRRRGARGGSRFARPFTVALLCSASLATFLVAPPRPAAADPFPPPVIRDESIAMSEAQRLGVPVEILSGRSETARLFAEPDGNQRLVVTARPERVLKGSEWVDVQPNLVPVDGGAVEPEASAVGVTFSGGGEGPLVRVVEDGVTLAFTWPTPLPAPSVEGAVATYADVIPGVDLKMSADVDGYSQVLVVKTPEAAARPELAELRVGYQVTGGGLSMDAAGNMTLVSGDGQVKLHGSTPQMWDSTATEDGGDRLAGPLTGDAVGSLAARLEDGTLVLTPDQEFLRAPGLTFPLYVDPPMHGAGRLAFAYVSKHFASTKYYGTKDVAKVGYYNDPRVPRGPTRDTYRSFFRMNTAGVNGKHIIKATFRTFETHSWSCSARAVQLWQTGAIGTGTTWNSQPSWRRQVASVNAAKGYYSRCGDGGVDFNATSAVVEAASKGWPNLTLGLRAASESDTFAWKKFRNNPSLEITYNTTPNIPDQRSSEIGASLGVPCATGDARPYVTTATLTLRARVSDADANKGQTVRAHFEWYNGSAKVGERYTAYVASGTPVTAPIPAGAFPDGARVTWRVRAQDGVATSGTSDWAPSCEMTIDRTRPANSPVVASADYPETPSGGDPVPSGGIGRMGTFTLTPGPLDKDIGSYLYALNSDSPGAAASVSAPAGTATIKATPLRSLLNVLYVWSRDKAGNIGPYKRYEFSVRAGTPATGHWRMDEATGTRVGDASGNGNEATLAEGAVWGKGRVGGGVRLDGTGARLGFVRETPIIRTDANFTVSTWVRLDDKSVTRTVMSQDGVDRSGFALQYNQPLDRWAMTMPSADSPSGGVTFATAKSDAPPRLDSWVHLGASFDAATRLITLYVDGRPQAATAVHPSPWHATGKFAIGRGPCCSEPWSGEVDDAKVWDRVVYHGDIANGAARPPALTGHWRFDGAGSVAGDSSGGRWDMRASGEAFSWTEGWIGGAVRFNGPGTRFVTIPPRLIPPNYPPPVPSPGDHPQLPTDASYTVAAWVRLADKLDQRTAVSMGGVNQASFLLQYSKAHDRWRFTVPVADTTTAAHAGPVSDDPAETGVWTHLVGVHDRGRGELKLYVDGTHQGTVASTTAWRGHNNVIIGQGHNDSGQWLGDVDDVRVYKGVLNDDEIYDLAAQ
ncbi:LamG-like jellyroll fold domain-containing protein [Sphaerisporangium sp. TRM90804]|uniref:LamG-like jellyroll fold domain-containing protein n=1 Tax=Sphaerisporangium sp. TRM90804 TaxID=3031113 RepID=UPI002446B868|nr:LamG-like jellyroll fold domain-containing protein [Sphaerisporangium sp. TRM90804]MDH2427170.1 DNRLRE domain-containing protein [Sphaerisporangium sp. TRM90804]